ncbi:hypothetical protein [Zobellia sp. OII3]|uniref:hypothetical protein n=1 Tax=Zobellia sp. OII3 TaxID=2034520 RepID=UPI000F511739|nr:hypothetical protein [Zobellia sp. OII3]
MKKIEWRNILGKLALSAVFLYMCYLFEQNLTKEFISRGSAKSSLARIIIYYASNNLISYYLVKIGLLILGLKPIYHLIKEYLQKNSTNNES